MVMVLVMDCASGAVDGAMCVCGARTVVSRLTVRKAAAAVVCHRRPVGASRCVLPVGGLVESRNCVLFVEELTNVCCWL